MNKALFLDRDGTINIDYGYVYEISKFTFIDGIFKLCKTAINKDYKIIIITNQSGIERGYYTTEDFHKLNEYMLNEFSKNNITITDVFFCPFLKSEDRKPNSGMFIKAKEKHNIDMANSISLGDKERDIIAGKNSGIGKNFLFNGNYKNVMEAL